MDNSGIWLVAVHRSSTGNLYAGQASGPYHPDEMFAIKWGESFLRTTGSTDPDIYRVENARERQDARAKAVHAAEKEAA